MGVSAMLGRTLTDADDRSSDPPAAVVSHGFWRQRLGADPAAIGTVVLLNGTAFTIVGVTPPEFFGERLRRAPDFWTPLAFQPQIELRPSALVRSDTRWLNLIRPARARCDRVRRRRPRRPRRCGSSSRTPRAGPSTTSGGRTFRSRGSNCRTARPACPVLRLAVFGAAARAAGGRRDGAPHRVRQRRQSAPVARGSPARPRSRCASRSARAAARLIRQSLTESLVLAGLGALSGIVLARWMVSALVALLAAGSPLRVDLSVPVLAFTIAITCATGVIFRLAPALIAGRTNAVDAINIGRSRRNARPPQSPRAARIRRPGNSRCRW